MSATYDQILSLAPAEAGRVSSTVIPQGGSTFNSRSKQTMQFLIPPISYLDGASSYLSCDVQLFTTPSANTTIAGNNTVCLDSSAHSLFEATTLYNSQNQVITQNLDYAQSALHMVRTKGFDYANTIYKNMSAGSSVLDQLTSVNGTTVAFPANITPADLAAEPGAISSVALGGTIPNSGSGGGVQVSGKKINVCIPLEFLSGALVPAKNRYLPLHLMGSRSHALRLDVTLADSARAIFVSGTDAALLSNSNTYFELSRVELICEYVNLGAETDAKVQALSEQGMLEYKFTDVSTRRVAGVGATDTFYSNQSSKFTMSLKGVAMQIRSNEWTTTGGGYRYPYVAATQRANLQSLQVKVGALYYPNAPLTLPSETYNGGAYAEFSKIAKSLSSIHGHANAPFYQRKDGFGVEFALDFDNKQSSGASCDESLTMSGRNTTSGSSQIEVRIEKGANAYEAELTLIFLSDNVVKVTGGVAVPVERS